MSIPSHQEFMRPLLELLADGNEWAISDIYDALAKQLELSKEDMEQLLPSKKQTTYKNRIGWAKTYLVKAKVIDSPRRGFFCINERGRKLLASHTDINTRTLQKFEEFQAFRKTDNGRYNEDNQKLQKRSLQS